MQKDTDPQRDLYLVHGQPLCSGLFSLCIAGAVVPDELLLQVTTVAVAVAVENASK